MATRIRPRPAPAEPVSPHIEPGATLLLAPPHNLNKRLTAAVHRSLPGWTVEVLVKRWTDTHVTVVIKGLRDAGGLAPPAPPTGSAEAEKLASRVARALERVVEQDQPGTDWVVVPDYFSADLNSFRLKLVGDQEGKKNDPPTCIDGDGEVIFPGDADIVSGENKVFVDYRPPKNGSGSIGFVLNACCVYFRYRRGQGPVPPLNGVTLVAYPDPGLPPAPKLVHANNVVPLNDGRTFIHVMHASDPPLFLYAIDLDGWWVWRWK